MQGNCNLKIIIINIYPELHMILYKTNNTIVTCLNMLKQYTWLWIEHQVIFVATICVMAVNTTVIIWISLIKICYFQHFST